MREGDASAQSRFDADILPHVRSGYNLARWLTRNDADEFDEALHNDRDDAPDPEKLAIERAGVDRIRGALETLPAPLREVVVLREQEGLSYKEIATIAGIPIGTVMSRLARARSRLLAALSEERKP